MRFAFAVSEKDFTALHTFPEEKEVVFSLETEWIPCFQKWSTSETTGKTKGFDLMVPKGANGPDGDNPSDAWMAYLPQSVARFALDGVAVGGPGGASSLRSAWRVPTDLADNLPPEPPNATACRGCRWPRRAASE